MWFSSNEDCDSKVWEVKGVGDSESVNRNEQNPELELEELKNLLTKWRICSGNLKVKPK